MVGLVDYFISSGRLFCFDEERRIYYLNEELSPHVVEIDQKTYGSSWTTFLLDGTQYGFDSVGNLWSRPAERRWGQVMLYGTWAEAICGLIELWETQS